MQTGKSRIMRRSVLTLLVLMATVLMPMIAFADDEHDNAPAITPGQTLMLTMTEAEDRYFKFVPEEDGTYFFKSSYVYDVDPDCVLEDKDYKEIEKDTVRGPFELKFDAEAGEEYYLKVHIWDLPDGADSIKFDIQLIQEKATSMEYVPVKPIELIENVDGNEMADWFNYKYSSQDGDRLILKYAEGSEEEYEEEYVLKKGERNIYVGDNRTIEARNVRLTDDQDMNHWTTGENRITVKYAGLSCELVANVIEQPYTKLSFRSDAGIKVYDGSGHEEHDGEGNPYMHYDLVPPYFHGGDILTFTMKNGTEAEYVFDVMDLIFYNRKDSSDYIPLWDLLLNLDGQEENHWTKGGNNTFVLEYRGLTCEVPVQVVDNTITGITLKPSTPYSLIENVDGRQTGSGFEYDYPEFRRGDELTVTTTEGSRKYIYTEAGYGGFLAEGSNDDIIFSFELEYDGDTTSWTKGGENTFTVGYMGKTATVPVNIVDDPVTGIEYKPVRPYEYSSDEAVGGKYSLPGFMNGDRLTVKCGDNEEDWKVYIFDYDNWSFVNKDNRNDTIKPKEVSMEADQVNHPWTKEGPNFVTVKALRNECRVQVTITDESEAVAQARAEAKALINEVDALNKDNYTPRSYNNVMTKKATLDNVLKDDTAKASDIRDYTDDLAKAMAQLVTRESGDREKAIENANRALKQVSLLVPSIYTEESYKAVTDAVAKLEALIADPDSKSGDINKAIAELNDALDGLVNEADAKAKAIEDANVAIDKAEALDKSKYTEESYKAVTDAVAKLKALIADPGSKGGDINKATEELNDALDGLVNEADAKAKAIEGANVAIDKAEALDESKYTEESYKAVTDAVAKLEALIADPGSKGGDINKATEELNKAIAQLKPIEDKPVVKKTNPLKVKGKTATVKYKKLKKKSQTISRAKAITVSGAQGKLAYKKVSVIYTKAKSVKMSKKALKKYKKQAAKKITVNAKTGKVIVKKGLKKGTYKVKVKVKAAGNANYNPSAWKTVTFKIKVK